jgi:Pvc16 N-terminal domain
VILCASTGAGETARSGGEICLGCRPGRRPAPPVRGEPVVMIEDADAALEALVRTVIPVTEAAIDFGAPSQEWASSLAQPCVNLFLHQLDEERSGRGADVEDVRDEAGRVVARRAPVRRYRLSYLVSAWPLGCARAPSVEHALLDRFVRLIANNDALPRSILSGSFFEEEARVDLELAEASEQRVRPHELWSALGVPPRACLDLVVSAPLVPARLSEVAAPAERIDLIASRTATPTATARGSHAGLGGGSLSGRGGPGGNQPRWTAFRARENK